MTQYVINIGALPNDGTGDPLRTAFNETNLNFDQVFAAGPVLSNVRIANNTILTTNTNGNLVLAPNGVGRIQANATILPSVANVRDLGSLDRRWNTVYSQYLNISGTVSLADLTVDGNLTVTGNTIQIGNITTETKTIQLANSASTANAANGSGVTVGSNDDIATLLYSSTSNTWNTNIGISAVGNVSGTYFIGNGSLLTGVASSYGNANVATLVASFGSNTVSTTGNISGGYLFGNGSQLTGLAATYGNANAVAYGESGWAGNIIPSGNSVYSLGNATNQWNDLYVSNATIFMNNVPISLTADNVLTVDGNAVLSNDSNTSITTTGTISAETLTANSTVNIGTGAIGIDEDNFLVVETLVPGGLRPSNDDIYLLGNTIHRWSEVHANVYYGDGSQLTGLSTNSISNGNSSVDIPVVDGNVTVSTNGTHGWTFDDTGNLLLPRGGIVYETNIPFGGLDGNTIALAPSGGTSADQQLLVYPTAGPDANHLHLTSGNLYNTELFLGNDNLYVKLANTGDIVINSNDDTGNSAQWTFGTTGNLTTPGGMIINGNVNFLGTDTALLNPADNTPLSLFSSGANGTVTSFWTDDIGNLMSSNIAALYLPLQGTQTVRIVNGNNGGNVAIYDFGNDGVFTTSQVSATGNITANYFSGNGSLLTGISASLPVANGTSNFDIATANGNATITANSASTWTFGTDSALTLPASSGQIGRSGYPNGIDLYNNNGGTGYVRMNYADESLISVDSGGAHVQTTGGTWDFNTTGNLTAPGNVSAVGNIIGGNIVTSGSGGDITMTGGNITGVGNISAGNLIATGNIVLTGSLVGSGASPAPSLSGFSSVSAVTLSASGNVTAGNVSATGNVTAANFFGNGNTLSNVATQVTGSWNVTAGTNNYSFTVPINNTYQLWVNGNIPNGIIVYNATVSVSNTNVPVIGQQFAWNYEGGGNILMFNSIPAQIIGTAGAISNAQPAVANTNVFTFSINNTSGNTVTVNYGYTKIS